MMSRITLNLKKEAHLPGAGGHRWDDAALDVSFSRDRSFSDATTRVRSRSYTPSDYLTGGADVGVNFKRPATVRRLSTIISERDLSVAHTPENGEGPGFESIDKMLWNSAQVTEEPEDHGHF
jgi:hypothetical protein